MGVGRRRTFNAGRVLDALGGGTVVFSAASSSWRLSKSSVHRVSAAGSGLRQLTVDEVRDGRYAWVQAP
jgi:hypothetical protein